MTRESTLARRFAGLLVAVVLVACAAEQPTETTVPTVGPTDTGPGPATDSPGSPDPRATPDAVSPDTVAPVTLDPDATLPPPPDRPDLPAPELEDPAEIGEAIQEPRTRAQGVVSMLRRLGIGIYGHDGTAIRAGDERESDDLWLYEDEVYALVDMAAFESPGDWVSFGDWHAGLTELGLEMSAAELARTYDDVYFGEFNESFFVGLINALGVYFDPDFVSESNLSRLQAWLLFVDGFVVRANESVGIGVPLAQVGPIVVAQQHAERWGGASARLPRLVSDADLPIDLAAAAARLETMARSVPFALSPERQQVHEGHGGQGNPVDFGLSFQPYVTLGLTPFGDEFFLQANPVPGDLPVRWEAATTAVLAEHGEVRDHNGADPFAAPTLTRSDGSAGLTYTPRQEEANGEGEIASDIVTVNAATDVHEIARRTWIVPQVLLGWLQTTGGTVSAQAALEIEWHEVRGLRIDITDEYDVSFEFPRVRGAEMSFGEVRRIGTDRFEGFLAEQEDGTWRGIVRGTTDGQWREEFPDGSCSTGLAGTQDLLVTAELTDYQRPGDVGVPIVLRFFPVAPPQVTQIGCDWELSRWTGPDADDPEIDPATAVPSEYYAPFNDQRIVNPLEVGFPTSMPADPGSVTNVYDERAPGIGGGTFTVTIELVEPTR